MKPWAIILLLVLSTFLDSWSQTCCSGGVPLTSNLGMPDSEAGAIQFSLNYDLNRMKSLYFEDDRLDDNTRERLTRSILLETSYHFNNRFSVDLLFSYVKLYRTINSSISRTQNTSSGLGDAVVLLRYKILSGINDFGVLIGGGLKMPSGSSDNRNELGIPFAADLQPGSGAWDQIAWLNAFKVSGFRPTLTFHSTFIYRFTGVNSNYLNGFSYEFGDEFQGIVTVSDRFTLGGKFMVDPSMGFRYRTTGPDRINDQEVPNTGGKWIILRPGLSLFLTSSLSINSMFEIPIYQFLEGTQLSTTWRYNLGMYFLINRLTGNKIVI